MADRNGAFFYGRVRSRMGACGQSESDSSTDSAAGTETTEEMQASVNDSETAAVEDEEPVEEKILLLSDENIDLYYIGSTSGAMQFRLENKTDVELACVFYSLSLDGVSYADLTGEGNSVYVSAGESLEYEQAMPDTFTGDSGEVSGEILYLENTDSDDPILEKKTFATSENIDESGIEGTLLFSDDSVSVYYAGSEGSAVSCTVVNKTGETMDFSFEDLTLGNQTFSFVSDDGYEQDQWFAPYSFAEYTVTVDEEISDDSTISGTIYYCGQTNYAYEEKAFSLE